MGPKRVHSAVHIYRQIDPQERDSDGAVVWDLTQHIGRKDGAYPEWQF
jgi:hypothetical protein